jgi:hypothetical protein
MERKALDQAEVQVNQELSENLQGLSRDELPVYSDILTRTGRQILWDTSVQLHVIDLDTSFFELGGDIIGLAQVTLLLEQEGYKLRAEDLVDYPVMIEQLALLAVHRKKEKERENAKAVEAADTNMPTKTPPETPEEQP